MLYMKNYMIIVVVVVHPLCSFYRTAIWCDQIWEKFTSWAPPVQVVRALHPLHIAWRKTTSWHTKTTIGPQKRIGLHFNFTIETRKWVFLFKGSWRRALKEGGGMCSFWIGWTAITNFIWRKGIKNTWIAKCTEYSNDISNELALPNHHLFM